MYEKFYFESLFCAIKRPYNEVDLMITKLDGSVMILTE